MSTLAIGVDIEQSKRFIKFKSTSSFIKMIFTQSEIDYCFQYKNFWTHLAARFTAKEAVLKAISHLNTKAVLMKDIEVIINKGGGPSITIHKPYFKKYKIILSISHTSEIAISFIIIYK